METRLVVALYARVSTRHQLQEATIESHWGNLFPPSLTDPSFRASAAAMISGKGAWLT